MVTDDFLAPVAPGTLRISVIWNDHLHRSDLLMTKIPDTIMAFEEFIGIDWRIVRSSGNWVTSDLMWRVWRSRRTGGMGKPHAAGCCASG